MKNYQKLEAEIFKKLRDNLDPHFRYHTIDHTREVVEMVDQYADEENISQHEKTLLKTAGLFHDLGFLESYHEHEKKSVQFAVNILPDYGYSDLEIEKISALILSTEYDKKPHNKLEEILRDADTDNLGREDYFEISEKLYKELLYYTEISRKQWQKRQLDFITNHQYYCKSAIRKREKGKQLNILRLKEVLNIP